MRRVLFIAYLYPPIANSGSRRSIEFANHLPAHGWAPTVLTVADPDTRPDRYDPSLLGDIAPGTRVERAPMGSAVWARRLTRWLPTPLRERGESSLSWRLQAFWSVPDDVAVWRGQAVAKGVALHRAEAFDLIYASGSPWTSFLVAHDLSARTGVPYVIDYRDVWTPSGDVPWQAETRAQAAFRARVQERLVRHAAAVVTVTPSLVDEIGADMRRSDVVCITNGYEPRDFEHLARPANDGQVRIAYTGVWRNGYGPGLLYEAMHAARTAGIPGLNRLRVELAGFAASPRRTAGLGDALVEHGPVSHAKAVELMAASHLLFVCVPKGAYARSSLPGKLFEYIGSGRPILAAVPADSEVARVLDYVGGSVRVDPDDVQTTLAVMAALCQGAPIPGMTPRRAERTAEYTRASTTRSLAAVFDRSIRMARLPELP